MIRVPTAKSFFSHINESHSKLAHVVVDVGAQCDTDFLRLSLKGAFHHLIEPLPAYHSALAKNYSEVSHQIHPVAICPDNAFEIAYLLHYSNYGNKSNITHTQLTFKTVEDINSIIKQSDNIVGFSEVKAITLDDLVRELNLPKHQTIFKIDIDGLDYEVLESSFLLRSYASFVIVESPIGKAQQFLELMDKRGFSLCEIVSPCYYENHLAQVDIIFINHALMPGYFEKKGEFLIDKWQNMASILEEY